MLPADQGRGGTWVLPTDKDCKGMNFNWANQDGYTLALVDAVFTPDFTENYERFTWACCDLALDCQIDADSKAAIAQFNRSARLDKLITRIDSTNA